MYTTFTQAEFFQLLSELNYLNERMGPDDAADALFMYLLKLRTARSYKEVGSFLKMTRQTVTRRIQEARESLKNDIVPNYLKVNRSREELASHKTVLIHAFFDEGVDGAIHLILDGTYVYIEKSKAHVHQKNTYNSHKKRNYVKIMVGTTPDGLIVFTDGPFMAKDNDATITNTLLSEANSKLNKLQPQDVVIVDRGFRDCMTELKNCGFIVKTPSCAPSNAQLTTNEANQTRLVTRIRYDIERINGVMKNTWKAFAMVWESQNVPVLMTDYEIASALVNRSKKSLTRNTNTENIGNRMMQRLNDRNLLSEFVIKPNIQKMLRKNELIQFIDLMMFPKLSDTLFHVDHTKSNRLSTTVEIILMQMKTFSKFSVFRTNKFVICVVVMICLLYDNC